MAMVEMASVYAAGVAVIEPVPVTTGIATERASSVSDWAIDVAACVFICCREVTIAPLPILSVPTLFTPSLLMLNGEVLGKMEVEMLSVLSPT